MIAKRDIVQGYNELKNEERERKEEKVVPWDSIKDAVTNSLMVHRVFDEESFKQWRKDTAYKLI